MIFITYIRLKLYFKLLFFGYYVVELLVRLLKTKANVQPTFFRPV